MIPLKLTIEGLYSYQTRQIIDFTALTNVGLFGIFGATGSGKSTILEAITFALYGKTERLNSKTSYNMMNLKSNRMYIEFDFENHEQKKYRAVREYKRNSKSFEDVKIKNNHQILYELIDEIPTPIESANIEKIIGLSYENFKRTIIIPQGQFKEFLELGATARATMMKEIFGLQRYDLQDVASSLYRDTENKFNELNGALNIYLNINKENIDEQEQLLKDKQTEFDIIEKEFKNIDKQYTLLRNLNDSFIELKKKKENFNSLKNQYTEITILEKKINEYEYFNQIFREPIKQISNKKKELLADKTEHENIQIKLIETENKISKTKSDLLEIQDYYNNLKDKRQEEKDLAFINKINLFTTEIITLKSRIEKGEATIKQEQNKLSELDKEKEELETSIKQLENKKIDTNLLLNIGGWFQKNEQFIRELEKQNNIVENKQNNLKDLVNEFAEKQIDINNYKEKFNQEEIQLNEKLNGLKNQKTHLDVQQKISSYAHELEDGKPCLLCGSIEHPNIIQVKNVSTEIEQLNIAIKQAEDKKVTLQKELLLTEKFITEKNKNEQEIQTEKSALNNLKNLISEHQKLFIWQDFEPNNKANFIKKRDTSTDIEKQIKTKRDVLEILNKKRTEINNNLAKFQKGIDQFIIEEATKKAEISTNKNNVQILNPDNYKTITAEEILTQLAALTNKNSIVEKNYNDWTNTLNNLNIQQASINTNNKILSKKIALLKDEIQAINQEINDALIQEKTTLENVNAILETTLDIKQNREKIQQFKIDYNTLKNSIDELNQKLQKSDFDEGNFIQIAEQWRIAETNKKVINELLIGIKNNLEKLKEDFKKKTVLLAAQEKVNQRLGNLKILQNLFKGSGFVQYVSTILLNQLCDQANVRFSRMTRGQMTLQVNNQNEFEIIDYLNDGKNRSVNTLSGGQAFQASLALALALAENVQSHAKAQKNFFFIDEGFGTQDSKSVNIVFDTLIDLNKENKIVGIISHVDELKERMPIALNVENDKEQGSLITISK